MYSVLAIAGGSAKVTCVLGENQRQAEEWESFIADKREGFRCALIEAFGMGKLVGGLTRNGASWGMTG